LDQNLLALFSTKSFWGLLIPGKGTSWETPFLGIPIKLGDLLVVDKPFGEIFEGLTSEELG